MLYDIETYHIVCGGYVEEAGKTLTHRIAANLRQQIVRGDIPPGGRLPSWNTLEESFDVTRTTLNRVFTQLRDDGFVYSSTKRGTYVVDKPPHLFRHGLAFPVQSNSDEFNRFWQTLAGEAESYSDDFGNHFECFFNVHTNLENSEHNRLLADVAGDRLASLTVVGHPQSVSQLIWERKQFPKIGVWEQTPRWPGPSIYLDRHAFVIRSLDHLQNMGCKRVAVLTSPNEPLSEYANAAKVRGMYHPPHWRLLAAANHPEAVRPIIGLLMSLEEKSLPDAIIIADDNLISDAIAALLHIDRDMPSRIKILAHCAWPKPVATRYPVTYLGYDARAVLRQALELASALRLEGAQPSNMTHIAIEPMFESEVAKN